MEVTRRPTQSAKRLARVPTSAEACDSVPDMRFGLDIAQQRMPWDELVRRVRLAEELGFDGAWGFDHFQPMYGEGPGETFEGMTTLAALAGLTTRIRLGLLVTGVTYRHPSVLAAEALTVDHASHGRLELALGAAWFDQEHHELGIPFPPIGERTALLQDALEVATRLFTGDVVTYEGNVVSLRKAQLRPTPVQQPHPPIWIGGSGPRRTLPLVARYADVWHSFGTPNSLRPAFERIDQLAIEVGRDPSDILRAGSLSLDDIETARKHATKWRDAGYGYLVCGWPGAGDAQVERFVREVVPDFAG
jgi:alkanesulfonate monooxygenase SsuD/methylene tetrahydromethanopterin reductase-like flavin-dependent oxidoreductase (luciferase family)